MLINLTNHPSSDWPEAQKNAASIYGDIIDYAFPIVSPLISKKEISNISETIFYDIIEKYGTKNTTIHVMGEFTLCYALINMFKAKGMLCLASTTERISIGNPDGTKTSTFKFVQFREY